MSIGSFPQKSTRQPAEFKTVKIGGTRACFSAGLERFQERGPLAVETFVRSARQAFGRINTALKGLDSIKGVELTDNEQRKFERLCNQLEAFRKRLADFPYGVWNGKQIDRMCDAVATLIYDLHNNANDYGLPIITTDTRCYDLNNNLDRGLPAAKSTHQDVVCDIIELLKVLRGDGDFREWADAYLDEYESYLEAHGVRKSETA